MASSESQMSPPYPPKFAAIGGVPTVGVDVPICAVFLALFIAAAVGHMTVLQVNLRRGHKFVMSGIIFGFCMSRVATLTMRIVWATRQTNVRVAIAASILVTAGILLLFILNLIFAQRILRAAHPHFGWNKAISRVFTVMYILIGLMLAMVITATVQSFYTLNVNTHKIDRDLQRTAGTYLMFLSFLPIPMVIIGLVIPRKTRVEKFGTGRWRSKIWILLTASTLLCLGASFRTGTSWKNPRPRDSPAWYDAKWCFYIFNFTIDIIVVYLYLVLRIDRRFHIPDGSKGMGDYSRSNIDKESEKGEEGRNSLGSTGRIMSEEEVFDDKEPTRGLTSMDEEAGM